MVVTQPTFHKAILPKDTNPRIYHVPLFWAFLGLDRLWSRRMIWRLCWPLKHPLWKVQNLSREHDHHHLVQRYQVSNHDKWYLSCANPKGPTGLQQCIVSLCLRWIVSHAQWFCQDRHQGRSQAWGKAWFSFGKHNSNSRWRSGSCRKAHLFRFWHILLNSGRESFFCSKFSSRKACLSFYLLPNIHLQMNQIQAFSEARSSLSHNYFYKQNRQPLVHLEPQNRHS